MPDQKDSGNAGFMCAPNCKGGLPGDYRSAGDQKERKSEWGGLAWEGRNLAVISDNDPSYDMGRYSKELFSAADCCLFHYDGDFLFPLREIQSETAEGSIRERKETSYIKVSINSHIHTEWVLFFIAPKV